MLSQDLDRYIVLQRACGLKFTTQPSLLRSFVACAEAAGDTYVRADRVLDWAARTTSAAQARNRLAIVRRFAMALAIEDSGHEVPSADAFGRWRFERRMPHIYTAEEIAALMAAARARPTGLDPARDHGHAHRPSGRDRAPRLRGAQARYR